MMAQNQAESIWEINNYGRYINQFPPNIIKSIRHYERINKKYVDKNVYYFQSNLYQCRNAANIYIIIIIIMPCRQYGYPWPSLATSPYHSSLLAGLQGYISYPHISALCMFELIFLLLLGHMRGSIGVHHWWVRPCFSSSVLHVWFV